MMIMIIILCVICVILIYIYYEYITRDMYVEYITTINQSNTARHHTFCFRFTLCPLPVALTSSSISNRSSLKLSLCAFIFLIWPSMVNIPLWRWYSNYIQRLIDIQTERQREKEREREMHTDTHIYYNIYIYTRGSYIIEYEINKRNTVQYTLYNI